MSYREAELVNQADLAKSRSELGSAFLRILSYFREDGDKAISAIRCVETREGPDELIEVVVSLRPCFTETMSLLDRDSNPLVARRPATFGRRSEPPSQGFGRVG